MKLEYLQYMLAISKCGSISKAARELYTTQPHLSKCIKEIENELNITIFIRQNNGVIPTEQGRHFLLHAARLVNEMDIMRSLCDPAYEDALEFSISTVRSSLVMDCFLQFLQDHWVEDPSNFHIREGSNNMTINDVYTRTSSLGVVQIHNSERTDFLARLQSKNIRYERIRALERQIILSKSHPLLQTGRPILTEDLYNYGFVRYETGMLFGSASADYLWYNTFFDLDRMSKQILVCDRASLNNILAQTDYFTIGTSPSIRQEEVHNMVSVPLEDHRPSAAFSAEMGYIYLDSVPITKLMREFIQLLLNSYS